MNKAVIMAGVIWNPIETPNNECSKTNGTNLNT